jgi:hypothetical protein
MERRYSDAAMPAAVPLADGKHWSLKNTPTASAWAFGSLDAAPA